MSDISRITTHDNIVYDLKDTVGRNLYSNIQKWIDDSTSTDRSYALGLQVDYENKVFTRLGLASTLIDPDTGRIISFSDIEPYASRKLVNLADDGTINAYYGDASYTEDGSNGQVMVYQPKFYYKVEPVRMDLIIPNTPEAGYHLRCANYWISPVPLTGYKLHPAFINEDGDEVDGYYTATYEACIYDTSASNYILDDGYNDGTNRILADFTTDKLSSISGAKPASGIYQDLTRTNLEQLAKNRGYGWHNTTIQIESAEQLLAMIEHGTANLQQESQGGIGGGVVLVSDTASLNCSAITGSTYNIGKLSGHASSTNVTRSINSSTKQLIVTTYTDNSYVSVRYRGRENPYGNMQKLVQGIIIGGNGNQQAGMPFICNDFSFDDSLTAVTSGTNNYDITLSGYTNAGFLLPNGANGYINAMGYGNPVFDWLFIASEIGGNTALPVGDQIWMTADLNGLHSVRLGGHWSDVNVAGPFHFAANGILSTHNRTMGGRLAYIARKTS